jgi:hypothetical protein
MWRYVLIVWPPSEDRLSDLYPRWYGSRELLLHGRDPYGADVSREIQDWLYGRPIAPGEDQDRFAYPLYVAFVIFPTIFCAFWPLNAFMPWLLLFLTAASVLLYLQVLGWRPPPLIMVLVLLLSLSSFPVAFGVRIRQLGLLTGLLLAASLACIKSNRLVSAGILLALATIKPQLTILIVPWLLLWTLGEWHARRAFFWSVILSLAALFTASEILVPGWIREFIAGAVAYTTYTDGRSILQLLLSRPLGSFAGALVVAALAVFCWRSRKAPVQSKEFLFCTALVLATTLVIIPTMVAHGQVLLFPGILLLAYFYPTIWQGGRAARLALAAAGLLLAWQWFATPAYSIAHEFLGTNFARRFWIVPVSASPVLPLALTITLLIVRHPILSRSLEDRVRP